MRRSLTLLFIGLVAVLVVAVTAAAKDGGRPLSTTLHGSEEAPAAGDPNATGFAALRLNQGQNRVCYRISWADVDGTVAASHIHRGPAGAAGPVIVNLFVGQAYSGTGSASGCTEGVDAALIKAIRQAEPLRVLRERAQHAELPRRGDSRPARGLTALGHTNLGAAAVPRLAPTMRASARAASTR